MTTKPNPFRVALVLLALAVTPLILTAWIGAPIPRDWPTTEQIETLLRGLTANHLHAGLRIIVWAAWLAVLVGSIWEVASYLSHRNRPAAPSRRPWFLRLTGGLALGATATTALTATTAATAEAETPDVDTDTDSTAPTKEPAKDDRRSSSADATATTAPIAHQDSHIETVEIGDNLWDISEEELGKSDKWTVIYKHNKNRPQPDGGKLTDPDLIRPGWKLTIPGTDDHATEPPRDTEPDNDPPPTITKPAPQLDDDFSHDASTDKTGTESDAGVPGVWIGFASAAFLAGLVLVVRKARHRVRRFEKRTGRTGPRLRLPRPLNHFNAENTEDDDLQHEADKPAALGIDSDDSPVLLAEACTNGLGVTGPGAEAVARAAIAAALTADDQDAASTGCDVVTTTATMAQLLDDADLSIDGIHRLWVYPTTDDVLRALSRGLIERTRDPEEAAPMLAVLDDDVDRQLAAVLTQGEYLGISALILADWPDNTINVAADGTTDTNSPTRCHTLTTPAFAATLTTLAEVAEVMEEPITLPEDEIADDETHHNFSQRPAVDDTDETEAAVLRDLDPVPQTTVESQQSDTGVEDEPQRPEPSDSATTQSAPEPSSVTSAPLRLRLLGEFAITHHGKDITVRRSKSRELLAYLAAQPQGASKETLLEAIVPDTAINKARSHLDSIITNTRKDLRTGTTEPNTTMFILHQHGTYRLDPAWFTSDLAEFGRYNTAAAATTDPTTKSELLTKLLEVYDGEFAADVDAESIWPHPIRADYAHHAHAACLTLADHAAAIADTAIAIQLLERTIDIDRYNEDAYRKLIQIHREHGHNDDATKVYQRLKATLATIGASPSSDSH